MFGLDAIELARAQFGFTVAFHIIFPAFSIGLASYLAVLEGLWLITGRAVYLDLFRYWVKIFSIGFGMGVVSGVVMSYQFGTNWAAFSRLAGPVVGPLMGYEVLTAFFLEAGFLGVMLFGMQKVGKWLHFGATCVVACGALLSAFWILAVNSWMNTPAGYTVAADGRFMPESWLKIIFNPSFHVRFPHMVLASYLSVAFVVGAVGAYHLLRQRDRRLEGARTMFSMAMWMAVLVAPVQILVGDMHGLNTLEYQPAKVAALEGHWNTERGAGLILFGLPDMQTETTRYAVVIPYLGSLILTHSWNGEVPGLKQVKPADRPYSPLIFWTFRAMAGIGFLMLGLGLWSLIDRAFGRLTEDRWLLRAAVAMGPSGFVAVIAGWITTEVGRQPYTVYGLLRTNDSVSPIGAPGVGASLVAFVIIYSLVFGAGIAFILRLMAKPPLPGEPGPSPQIPSHTASLLPGVAP
jgi:cytochrome d ubiquinol oxidase subunit I